MNIHLKKRPGREGCLNQNEKRRKWISNEFQTYGSTDDAALLPCIARQPREHTSLTWMLEERKNGMLGMSFSCMIQLTLVCIAWVTNGVREGLCQGKGKGREEKGGGGTVLQHQHRWKSFVFQLAGGLVHILLEQCSPWIQPMKRILTWRWLQQTLELKKSTKIPNTWSCSLRIFFFSLVYSICFVVWGSWTQTFTLGLRDF